MTDILTHLSKLRRPSLLMRAARIGAAEYRRGAHLARVLGMSAQKDVLNALCEVEEVLNIQRLQGDGSYNVTRHVDVMIALVAEAQARLAASGQAA